MNLAEKFSAFIKSIKPDAWATIAFFLLSLDMYHPGLMSNDSIFMLGEAVSGKVLDNQSPLMTAVWTLTNKIYFGPMGMLVFHNIIFWVALFLLARNIFERTRNRIWFVAAFGFFPPVFNQIGYVSKDMSLGASLFLAVVLIFMTAEKPSLKNKLMGPAVFCLFYGMGARLNSSPAVFVLCSWTAYVYFKDTKHHRLVPIAVGVALSAVLFGFNILFIDHIVHGEKTHPGQTVEVFDLAAISLSKGELLFPDYIKTRHDLTLDKLKASYRPGDVAGYFWPELIPFSSDEEEHSQLKQLWLSTVFNNFGEYLKHRLEYFRQFMFHTTDPLQLSLDPNPFGLHFRSNWIWRGYYDFVRRFLQDSFIFKAYPYVLLLLIVMGSAFFTSSIDWPPIWIASSGLIYALGYFFYGPNCAFRYIYWSVLAALIAASLHLRTLWNRRART